MRFFLDQPAAPAEKAEEQVSPKPRKKAKKVKMPETKTETAAAAPAAPVEAAAPVAAPVAAAPAPVATTAVVEQPAAPSADELSKVMASAGGGGAGLIAMVIVVAGGAAGWKFWNKLSEQRHEQKMKQMEIDAQSQGLGNAQPIPCQAVAKVQADAIASMKAQLEELSAKVAKVEKKSASFSADFDSEELEAWQKKVDKDLKALKAAKRSS